jgi:hypothetical protein
MIDEEGCFESDVPAVNGPSLHTASQCREYVHAALRTYKREVGVLRSVLAGAASSLQDAANGAPLSCARLARERVDAALGPTYLAGVQRITKAKDIVEKGQT